MPELPEEKKSLSDLEAAKAHQAIFLAELKAREEPYTVRVQGVDIVVNPGVFPPTTDSHLLAGYIQVNPGERVLDLTTGSGVFAVLAGLKGGSGVAADLNPAAVVNANENFKRFAVNFEAIKSDLFEKVPKEKFDQVLVNGPYTEGEVTDPLQLAFYGARSYLARFFSSAADYLKLDGKVLITFADWGEVDFLQSTAKANGFSLEVVDKKKSDTSDRMYTLYEARFKG